MRKGAKRLLRKRFCEGKKVSKNTKKRFRFIGNAFLLAERLFFELYHLEVILNFLSDSADEARGVMRFDCIDNVHAVPKRHAEAAGIERRAKGFDGLDPCAFPDQFTGFADEYVKTASGASVRKTENARMGFEELKV